MNLEVRRPTKEDRQKIHQLFSISVKDNFRKEKVFDPLNEKSNVEIEALKDILEIDYQTAGSSEYFLIAVEEGKVLGSIAYGKLSQIICDNLNMNPTEAFEIKSVYVLPDFQGQGIGSLLFEKMIRLIHEKHIEYFYLDSGYKEAKLFWQKKLGDPAHIIKDFWGKGIDHMIWYKRVEDFWI